MCKSQIIESLLKKNFPNGGKDISELGNYYFPFFFIY